TELIRRKTGEDAFAFTWPLLTKSDGNKFGKSEKGNIWLSAEKTSPYTFYQFWLNTSDADAEKFLKIFTFLNQDEIQDITNKHKDNESLRLLQKKLAEELTVFVHSRKDYEFAERASSILFTNDTAEVLRELNEVQLLQVMEGVPAINLKKEDILKSDILNFLSNSGIFASKGDAKKMLLSGAISINKEKVEQITTKMDAYSFLNDKYLLIQKGKKNYFLVKAE
ncbi:MAG: tyrosine--tRNA ligase, partial [Ginsengibacter sp.]